MTFEEFIAFFYEHPELIQKALKKMKEMEAEESSDVI